MTDSVPAQANPVQSDNAQLNTSGGSLARWAYAGTIFLSAFLLFQVQPLISKFILPWFGGSPAVWTAAMLFFQSVLFGGYLYAHLLTTRIPRSAQWRVHLGLLILAAIVVAITQSTPWSGLRPSGEEGESPLLKVLIVLGASVGLPYFVLSSTGPLIQKWFSDAFPGASPYRLFALSNFGSLLALLSYPFFFEVHWGSITQARWWSVGFIAFAVSCGICAVWTHRLRSRAAAANPDTTTESHAVGPRASTLQRIGWIGLPALASVMFLAITNEVCQNVATVPLLWIIPLSLYLLSFIIAFDHPRWYQPWIVATITAVLLITLAGWSDIGDWIDLAIAKVFNTEEEFAGHWIVECGVYFAALFAVCVLCHGQLARLKPAPQDLTAYYMTMSLGGAVGGLFVNLVAPHVFVTFFELTLSMLAALVVAAGIAWYYLYIVRRSDLANAKVKPQLEMRFVGAAVLSTLALVGAVYWIIWPSYSDRVTYRGSTMHRARNFYGVLSVTKRRIGEPDERYTFFSGHIQHGQQYADPAKREQPLTYYGNNSGVGMAILEQQKRNPSIHIGVVGLGIGTLATYARPEDRVRFYEINPAVLSIAQNESWFHFLGDCKGKYEVVMGDARLQLERELEKGGGQQFDVLCLDAFSGDAIPTHLLTTEAFAVYRKHLKPTGALAVHITNTYLDLFPVVAKLAEEHGLKMTRMYRVQDSETNLYRNYYVVLSQDQSLIDALPESLDEMPEDFHAPKNVPLWTDQYSNLMLILR